VDLGMGGKVRNGDHNASLLFLCPRFLCPISVWRATGSWPVVFLPREHSIRGWWFATVIRMFDHGLHGLTRMGERNAIRHHHRNPRDGLGRQSSQAPQAVPPRGWISWSAPTAGVSAPPKSMPSAISCRASSTKEWTPTRPNSTLGGTAPAPPPRAISKPDTRPPTRKIQFEQHFSCQGGLDAGKSTS
jgi:hypothetical protein